MSFRQRGMMSPRRLGSVASPCLLVERLRDAAVPIPLPGSMWFRFPLRWRWTDPAAILRIRHKPTRRGWPSPREALPARHGKPGQGLRA